jgi:hypothetical protein
MYCYRRSSFAKSASVSYISRFEVYRDVCCMCFIEPSEPNHYVDDVPSLEVTRYHAAMMGDTV